MSCASSRAVSGRLSSSASALGLERSEIDEVVIPSRKLQHPRSRREKLTSEESDRQLRIIRVPSSAEAAYLGRGGRALAWLRKSQPRLEGRSLFVAEYGHRQPYRRTDVDPDR